MVTGELDHKKTRNLAYAIWKGKKFPALFINLAYEIGGTGGKQELPWENEAYGRQDEVFQDAVNNIPLPARVHLGKYGMTDRTKVKE